MFTELTLLFHWIDNNYDLNCKWTKRFDPLYEQGTLLIDWKSVHDEMWKRFFPGTGTVLHLSPFWSFRFTAKIQSNAPPGRVICDKLWKLCDKFLIGPMNLTNSAVSVSELQMHEVCKANSDVNILFRSSFLIVHPIANIILTNQPVI